MLGSLQSVRSALVDIPLADTGRGLVVTPVSTEQVASIARCCNEAGVPLEIAGAGTKRNWEGTAEADIILETSRLTGVREHPWQDLTATVGAGTPWSEMQHTLSQHGQMVALDPLWPERATVGGVLATNDSGAWRLKYGSARDLVIGMTLVLADGTVARTGGKVVKNVAGYDLHKLMIGAFGTLAVVTEVTFRLHPLPRNSTTWTISSGSAEYIGHLLSSILDSQFNPEAVQMRARGDTFSLDVLLSGSPDAIGETARMLAALANRPGSASPSLIQDNSVNVFRIREHLFTEDACVVKITMLPTGIARANAEVVRLGGSAVTQAVGVMYASFPAATATEPMKQLSRLAHASGQGTVTVLQGGVSSAAPGYTPPAVMREVKRQFDPARILNRGRMGGL